MNGSTHCDSGSSASVPTGSSGTSSVVEVESSVVEVVDVVGTSSVAVDADVEVLVSSSAVVVAASPQASPRRRVHAGMAERTGRMGRM